MFYKSRSINPLNYFNEATKTVRALSLLLSTVLITFVFTTPSFAAGVEAVKAKNRAYVAQSPQRMQQSVQKAIDIIAQLRSNWLAETQKATLSEELKTLLSQIEEEDGYAQEQFEQMRAQIREKGLPERFLARVDAMQQAYEQRKSRLSKAMQALIAEHTGSVLVRWYYRLFGGEDAADLNVSEYESDTHQTFDPNNLPFQLRKAKPVKPKTSKAEFVSQGLRNQPMPHYAALGDFDYSTLAGASDPAYLAQSDEINITQAIRDKAAELDYDAVKIYNYVRNNIEFVPSWGAVQSAELTLGAKRGNAMDIASLLIALLRASKIPARYVHGTIELPVEKVKNWFGGWENINSALTFAYSNGLPAMTITGGGQVDAVRMEHVWVEVATDYYPSRGAKNYKADAWIPLDASYKQYEFEEGMDALSASGVDINATLQSFIDSADINETEGSVAHMDSAIIEDMLAQAQANLEANITTAIVDNNQSLIEVIGGKKIIPETYSTLPDALSAKVLVVGARYAKLPSALQQKVTYYLEPLTQEAAIEEMQNGAKTVTLPYARVNNQKLTLSYAPATQADREALEALLPEGNITDVSQLPDTLPSYIHVKPQLKLNGNVILEGYEMALGESLNIDQAVSPVNAASAGYKKHKSTAGDYLALGTVAQSISPAILKKQKIRMSEIKEIFESGDKNAINKLDKEDTLGNLHYSAMLAYYANLEIKSSVLRKQLKVFETITGYGTFGSEVSISSRFGLPTGIKAGSIGFDIPLSKTIVSDNNDKNNFSAYRIHSSMIASSLEHQVPEKFYQSSSGGISTIKILRLAASENQKIYTLTQKNMYQVLPNIEMNDLTKSEIINSLDSGKTVIVHESPVHIGSWTGTGYMVMDTVNYDSAWMISGGTNGGGIPDWAANSLTLVVGIGGIIATSILFNVILVAVTLALVLDSYADFLNLMIERDVVTGKCIDTAVTMTGLLAILSFVGLLAPIFLSIMLTVYAVIATEIENFIIRNLCPYVSLGSIRKTYYA